MLSPDQLKGYVDIAVSLLGAGGFGAIVLAVIGLKKASTEKPPEPERPSVGPAGMAGIAGLLAGEHFGMELLQHLRELKDALKALGQEIENGRRTMRETSEERRNDAKRIAEEIDSLTDKLRDLRASGSH